MNSIVFVTPNPNNTPIPAPNKPSKPDSIKKIVKMSLFCAPIAFIKPISFVLSITEVYIVFEIPIAPTNNEIAATPAKNPVIILSMPWKLSKSSSGVRISKS